MNYIICHYSEIGLKGKNRKFFEEKLVENLRQSLDSYFFEFVKRISGRIIIKLTSEGEKKQEQIQDSLKNVFGLAYFCFAQSVEQNIEVIQQKALEFLEHKEFKSFRVLTQRSKKDFYLTSPKINEKVGAWLNERLNKKVDLKNPDLICFIEIVEKFAFLYLEKIRGPGGLPVGVSGKGLVLLSGGIDSPVAAFYLIKRGLKMLFIHFHAYPYTNDDSIKKAKKLVKILTKFQFQSKLYLIPFADIQKEILLNAPAKLRIVLYRRMMFRVAQEVAKKEKARVLVTGESLGQVASQTLENIGVINQTVELLILRPLVGQDKEEIIKKAKEINTFNISILPDQDCCSRFLPKHPETRARLKDVEKAEKEIRIKKLIKAAVRKSEIEKFSLS